MTCPKGFEIMKIYIYPNLSKTNCFEYAVSACEKLLQCGAELLMCSVYKEKFKTIDGVRFENEIDCITECDIVTAIGGDGTILKCSVLSSLYNKPILGINCGRLGFMASLEHSQLELLSQLCSGDYTLSKRMMLNVKICSEDGNVKNFTALNDVVVSKSDDCKIADYEVLKNGNDISSLRADGVILSTATGSTAYSMSAGGPIIEPEMECIEFSQICSHSLFARSMVLSADSVVEVHFHGNKDTHSYVNVDGNNICRIMQHDIVIVSKSDYHVDIIELCKGSFFSTINRKLMQPLKESTEGII